MHFILRITRYWANCNEQGKKIIKFEIFSGFGKTRIRFSFFFLVICFHFNHPSVRSWIKGVLLTQVTKVFVSQFTAFREILGLEGMEIEKLGFSILSRISKGMWFIPLSCIVISLVRLFSFPSPIKACNGSLEHSLRNNELRSR